MILHIVIIFLMKLQCDALGNATQASQGFTGKVIKLIAAVGSNVNLPCAYSRNQSDMVTLILFYRNASHVGQVGAPLYTLDARMMNDHKESDVNITSNKRKDQQTRPTYQYNNEPINRRNQNAFSLINNANSLDHLIHRSSMIDNNEPQLLTYKQRLFKRSANYSLTVRNNNQSRYSNTERLSTSVGNVSMVNGISSLMHLLAIKGQLNQSSLGTVASRLASEEEIGREHINLNFNHTKLINIDKKNGRPNAKLHESNEQIVYRSQEQNDEHWPLRIRKIVESNSQIINLYEQKASMKKEMMNSDNIDNQSIDYTENQPLHFVAANLADRIRLLWPPSILRQRQPYNSHMETNTAILSNSTITNYSNNKKLESRSQTNHIKHDPLLHFNALLNIKNTTDEDAGEYLCRVDLRYGRTMIQHIVLEIVSPPEKVIILDSNSQVLHDWTTAYLENVKTTFNCEVDGGRPQTPIEWLLNGELLNPTWSNSIKLQNSGVTRSQLHLQMTRELFNSSLGCRAQNQFFTMLASVRIDLILKPLRITLRPTINPLVVDNQIDLIAQTHGSYPPADLVCFLRNQTLSGEMKKANHLKLFSTTTLIIKYIPNRFDHNGEVICKAINHAFSVNESIELRYKLDIHYKPILKLRLRNSNSNRLIEHSSLALDCEIDSNPAIKEIQWFKNDLLFTALNNQIQSELRVDNTSLVTNSLSKLDTGRYSCSGRNSVGTRDSESIVIDVLHAPECRSNQKFIYGIEYGETTVINCELISNPSERLTFHWRWHSNSDTIDLATISTQMDVDSNKKLNTPSYLPLIHKFAGAIIVNSSNDDPIASRYLPSIDTMHKNPKKYRSSNLFTNNPLMPSSNTERSNLLQQIFISSNGSSSSLHYTMKYNSKDIGSYVECWASNTIGVQKEPCMYSLVVLDVPDPVENCTISAPINNFNLLECNPGRDGGLPPQLFHLEVYIEVYQETVTKEESEEVITSQQPVENHYLLNDRSLDQSTNQLDKNEFKPMQQGQSKPFVRMRSENRPELNEEPNHHHHVNNYHMNSNQKINQLDEYEDYANYKSTEQRPIQFVLIANYTEYSYPTFVLSLMNMNLTDLDFNKLSNIDTLHLNIYSSNPKGRSDKISLDFNLGNQTNQLKSLFAKTDYKETKFNLLNEWTLILTAAFSTLSLWFICLLCYLCISNKIKQIKMTRRYLNNYNKNAAKINQQQHSLVPVNHQGALIPFIDNNINEITHSQCNVIGRPEFHDQSSVVYGSSSMIINHFEAKKFQPSSNSLSSAELLKLKIKQLD